MRIKCIIIWVFILFFALFLFGCGDNKNNRYEYTKSIITDLGITRPLIQDGEVYIYDNIAIFHSIKSDRESARIEYYSVNLDGKESPVTMNIGVDAYKFCCDYFSEKKLYVCSETEGGYEVRSYDFKGQLKETVLINRETIYGEYIKSFAVDNEENLYFSTDNEYYFYNPKTKQVIAKDASDYDFRKFLPGFSPKEVTVSVVSKEGDFCILQLDSNLKNNVILRSDKELKGLTYYNGDLFCLLDEAFYRIDKDGKKQKNISLDDIVFLSDSIQGTFVKDKNYSLILKSPLDDAIYVRTFYEDEEKKDEKKTISIYDPYNISESSCPKVIFDTFNERHDDIEAVLVTNDEEASVYLSKNRPDLILGYYQDINELSKKQYMEDLLPYIKGEKYGICEEDFHDSILNLLSVQGKLYGIPRFIEYDTVVCGMSKINNEQSWTDLEFVDWIKTSSSAKNTFWLNSRTLLQICLEGSLAKYVDISRGEYKDNSSLLNLLESIKKSGVDDKRDLIFDATQDFVVLPCGTIPSIASVDATLNEKGRFKGFPSNDGKKMNKLYCNTIGMTAYCENKEAAMEFINYYITYKYGAWERLYSTKELTKRSINNCIGLELYSADNSEPLFITEEEIDRVIDGLDNLFILSKEEDELIQIILSEADSYFYGNTPIEETVNKIEKRINLYMSERN